MKNTRTVIHQYLRMLSREMTCSKKQKRKFLTQLQTDIEEYADAYSGFFDMQAIEAHFGKPQMVAAAFLETENYDEVQKAFSTRKIVILCTILACVLALISILGYIAYDHWREEEYLKGHIIEITYETVDGTPPPEPEGTRIY